MAKIKTWLRNEFWTDYSLFEKLFMVGMVALQIVVFCITPDSWMNIVAGISGVISVVLCAKGKISFYFIGFVQKIICLWLTYDAKLYGEFAENIFYIGTMIWGIFVWKKNMTKAESGAKSIKAKKFTWWQWLVAIVVTALATFGVGLFLQNIGSNQPYTDAATNIMAIVAQLLMIWGFREQWAWWVVIDLLCIKMWIVAGNWSMVAMYVAWTINCIYGWVNWSKLSKGGE